MTNDEAIELAQAKIRVAYGAIYDSPSLRRDVDCNEALGALANASNAIDRLAAAVRKSTDSEAFKQEKAN